MMICLIPTHNVIRIHHKSCWRQLSYCGLPVRAVSVFRKNRCALQFFGVFLCGFAVFGPPLRRPPDTVFLSLQSILLKFGQWMPFYGNDRVWSLWNLTVKFKGCLCIGHWFINVSVSMPQSLLRLVNLNTCLFYLTLTGFLLVFVLLFNFFC